MATSRIAGGTWRQSAAIAPLRLRDFRLFWIGNLVSQCGDQFQLVGLAILALNLTHDPATLGPDRAEHWLDRTGATTGPARSRRPDRHRRGSRSRRSLDDSAGSRGRALPGDGGTGGLRNHVRYPGPDPRPGRDTRAPWRPPTVPSERRPDHDVTPGPPNTLTKATPSSSIPGASDDRDGVNARRTQGSIASP